MSSTITDTTMEKTHGSLKELLNDVVGNGSNNLLNLLKKKHYWPALQVKTFNKEPGMVLLHNTYKRDDVSAFQELYDECRSVVLDLDAPEGENIVVSLANGIPERIDDGMYEHRWNIDDQCERSYEGTVVSVFYHREKWFFSTSTCPSVNDSRFSHPTKKHGEMFDEALDNVNLTREKLTENLDTDKTYTFLMVHHENGHIMKVAEEFGDDKFTGIFHIGTRSRETLEQIAIVDNDKLKGIGIRYPDRYESPEAALEWLHSHPEAYGFIARNTRTGTITKVSRPNIIELEQMDYGNANVWHNFVWIYKQNKPHFHVNDYIARFCPDIKLPVDHAGRNMAPVYMIHTVICTIRDILLELYRRTTQYFPQYHRFKMDTHADASLAPILRFHLAQLRRIQITTHTDVMVHSKTIYHYLCYHTTMKNMRMLIKFFARSPQPMMNARAAECFTVLDACLSD